MTTLAYSHTLVAGTPENINDVQDMFNDVKTLVNGNLDATNLAATAKPATLMGAYRTVSEASLALTNANAGAAWLPTGSGTAFAVGATPSTNVFNVVPLTVSDYAVSGLTTQFRIQASTMTNTVAPGVNFTFSLASVASTGGGAPGVISIASIGTLLGSVTRVAPGSGLGLIDAGSDFTASTNLYVLVVTSSGQPAVNSHTEFTVRLQVHNI